jgi:hypothetical protein
MDTQYRHSELEPEAKYAIEHLEPTYNLDNPN